VVYCCLVFLPETSEKILDALQTQQRDFDSLAKFGQLETDHAVIKKMQPLFARIDEKKFFAQKAKPKKAEEPKIDVDDFAKVELKVGTIVSCEKHPKSRSFYWWKQIDLGDENTSNC
jgi:methionyl-tRNA synthetase